MRISFLSVFSLIVIFITIPSFVGVFWFMHTFLPFLLLLAHVSTRTIPKEKMFFVLCHLQVFVLTNNIILSDFGTLSWFQHFISFNPRIYCFQLLNLTCPLPLISYLILQNLLKFCISAFLYSVDISFLYGYKLDALFTVTSYDYFVLLCSENLWNQLTSTYYTQ